MSSRKVTQIKLPVRTKNNTTDEVLSMILAYGERGISQTEISKIFSLDSRDSSRIVGSLEKKSLIIREKMLYKGRWTFKLVVKKSLQTDDYSKSIDMESIEQAPCFRCLHQHSCSPDDDTSQYNPSKCMWIEEWVVAAHNTVLTSQSGKESRLNL